MTTTAMTTTTGAGPTDEAADTAADYGFRKVRLAEKQGLVDDVFHRVARRYDLMNDVMSGGLHRLWKDALVSQLAPPRTGRRPWRSVDVAGGTGDVAFRILGRASEAAEVTVCDINAEMLAVGRDRAEARRLGDRVRFVQGNAEALPFEAGSFDAYTIAFGIRNVPRRDAALAEARRVLKPGGRFLCLEFSSVDVPGLDRIYEAYSFHVIPRLARVVAGEDEPYRYLVESIRTFPNPERFAAMIRRAGFERVSYRLLSGGIAAIHAGTRI